MKIEGKDVVVWYQHKNGKYTGKTFAVVYDGDMRFVGISRSGGAQFAKKIGRDVAIGRASSAMAHFNDCYRKGYGLNSGSYRGTHDDAETLFVCNYHDQGKNRSPKEITKIICSASFPIEALTLDDELSKAASRINQIPRHLLTTSPRKEAAKTAD